ncbi:hypothetical protein BN2497_3465 [Janthinobacterium sp. CG23_2]|nr:hypothetical protein BN2497_3465 [Janthinobacterium sp. CG23_2]CUU28130.1 hypothetical protein BN3177_3465 [Janthinobacterium sp. CG23_2]
MKPYDLFSNDGFAKLILDYTQQPDMGNYCQLSGVARAL